MFLTDLMRLSSSFNVAEATGDELKCRVATTQAAARGTAALTATREVAWSIMIVAAGQGQLLATGKESVRREVSQDGSQQLETGFSAQGYFLCVVYYPTPGRLRSVPS